VKYPGAMWTVLLVLLPLFADWLTQYFGAAQWALPLAALLLLVAKAIEVLGAQKPEAAADTQEAWHEEQPQAAPESALLRWLVG